MGRLYVVSLGDLEEVQAMAHLIAIKHDWIGLRPTPQETHEHLGQEMILICYYASLTSYL